MECQPSIWAIVLNWNGWEDTLRCLASLRAQDYSNYRILIVDNGSSDESVERLRNADAAPPLLALSENLGFAGGMNRGMEYAVAQGADFCLLVNNDAELAPDALRLLVEGARRHPEVGIVVPTIFQRIPGAPIWYAGGSLSRWTGTARHWTRPADRAISVSFGTGCCMLIRASLLPSVGTLNEDYFLYFEDVEYCDRMREAGYGILYEPQAKIWHAAGSSTGSHHRKAPALDYYDVRNSLRFILERLRGFERISALVYLWGVRFPRKIVRILRSGQWENAKAVLLGLRHGLENRLGSMTRASRL